MSIEAISAVAAGAAAPATIAPAAATAPLTPALLAPAPLTIAESPRAQGAVFDAIVDSIAQVNRDMQVTQQAVQDMALGKSDNLHQVMMSLEQTRLSFELLLQVRNRVLEAYQEMMRMQV